ncbi:hypothetical protein A2U01_0074711, partial [Trifolium medium]|nr:hypothetical protein [Trifolium medium]
MLLKVRLTELLSPSSSSAAYAGSDSAASI